MKSAKSNIYDSALVALFSTIISLFMMNQIFYAIGSPILCGYSVGLGVRCVLLGERVVVVKHFFL